MLGLLFRLWIIPCGVVQGLSINMEIVVTGRALPRADRCLTGGLQDGFVDNGRRGEVDVALDGCVIGGLGNGGRANSSGCCGHLRGSKSSGLRTIVGSLGLRNWRVDGMNCRSTR